MANDNQADVTIENLDDTSVDTGETSPLTDLENTTVSAENAGAAAESAEIATLGDLDRSQIVQSDYGQLWNRSIVREMETSYLDYAMSVIVARALPDARDGMKPVHRRILYSMHRSGIHYNTPYKKSARIVGDVLGKYHPHGDASVYMALVRLAQPFSMRYPLVDGQGNFGSVDGDAPAAMRYTEARMARITEEILADIDKNTVPMIDNFDGSLKEPAVLPGKVPNLLLMGSEGIAVGMATKIPPHNLTEVGHAIINMIKHGQVDSAETIAADKIIKPTDKDSLAANHALIDEAVTLDAKKIAGHFVSNITFEEIMSDIKGPDFPSGGIIFDQKGIMEVYRTGKGRIVNRAKAEIVDDGKGHIQIIATEIPYQVNKSLLIKKLSELSKLKKIVGIKNADDHSDRHGMQITIDLKKDAQPKVILNKLYQLTEFQVNFPVNMVALNCEGVPQLMNIKQILREYILHRQLVVIRRCQFELAKARDRAHILEGLLIALDNIDEVIKTIRQSYDDADKRLMEKFGLSKIQADAILAMQLRRLQGLEREKLEAEYEQLQKTINLLLEKLATPQQILDTISQEMEELIATYGDERLTTVVKSKVGEFSSEDLIPDQETIITLTQTNYIKRLPPDTFRAQSRGGKGTAGVKMKEDDMVKCILSVNTHDNLLLFTNLGRVFQLKAHEIPEVSRTAKGTATVNLINLKAGEKVEFILKIDFTADADKHIALITKAGLVKKTAVKQFDNIRGNGIIAIALNKDDELVWGQLVSQKDDILLVTKGGMCIRFCEDQVKATSRDTKGVKGITLRHDEVVDVEIIHPEDQGQGYFLLTITAKGMGKMTAIEQYPQQNRAGTGLKVAIVNDKTGPIARAFLIKDKSQEIIISTKSGQTIKMALKDVPTPARVSQGVILIRLDDDQVATATLTGEKE